MNINSKIQNLSNNKPKAVLIQPKEPFPPIAEMPISIIGLTGILKEGGFQVEVIDARKDNLSYIQTINKIEQMNPDIVGITGLSSVYRYIKDFSFEFKRKFPSVPLIAGGAFIMSQYESILRKTPIDVACISEGEEIIVPLFKKMISGEPIDNITNIAYLSNGKIRKNPIELIKDFDKFPFPDYDILEMSSYLNAKHNIAQVGEYFFPIFTGRGCLHHCYYCGRPYSKIRRPSPGRVIEHLNLIYKNYGIKNFSFSYEDSLTYPRSWIMDLCEQLIKLNKDYRFHGVTCADQMDEEVVLKMKNAGFELLSFGVEHWDPEIQKNFFRPKQSKHLIEALELCKKYQIYEYNFNILWGHPKDNVTNLRKAYYTSLEIMDKYDVGSVSVATLVVYPNCKLHKDALRMKKILDYEDYLYALDGYAPYVNLTEENDDIFKGVIVEQKMVQNIELFMEYINYLIFNAESFDLKQLEVFKNNINASLHNLYILKALLNEPPEVREQNRHILEQLMPIPLYNKKKNYYQDIACFKEILVLPKGSSVCLMEPQSFSPENLSRFFNSIREAKVELKGFVSTVPSNELFEGYKLIGLDNINHLNAHFLLLPENILNNLNTRELLFNSFPGEKIIQISNASMQERKWGANTLTSWYPNKNFWKIKFENGNFTKNFHPPRFTFTEESIEPKKKSSISSISNNNDKKPVCFFLHTIDQNLIHKHYQDNSHLISASYDTQMKEILNQHYGMINSFSYWLNKNGFEAHDLIVNCEYLQKTWAKQNNYEGDLPAILLEQLSVHQPEIIYFCDMGTVSKDLINIIKSSSFNKLIVGQLYSEIQIDNNLQFYDIIMSPSFQLTEKIKKLNISADNIPFGYEHRIMNSVDYQNRLYPITYIGDLSNHTEHTKNLIEAIAKKFPILIWGKGIETFHHNSWVRKRYQGEVSGLKLFSILEQSKITLNFNNGENHYLNKRIFEATGSGALLITEYDKNLFNYFQIGKEIIHFKQIDECIAFIEFFLSNSKEAMDIARSGQEKTLQNYTYEKNIKKISSVLNTHLDINDQKKKRIAFSK